MPISIELADQLVEYDSSEIPSKAQQAQCQVTGQLGDFMVASNVHTLTLLVDERYFEDVPQLADLDHVTCLAVALGSVTGTFRIDTETDVTGGILLHIDRWPHIAWETVIRAVKACVSRYCDPTTWTHISREGLGAL